MADYRVTVETRGVEVYYIDAESVKDAEDRWEEGELLYQEVTAVVDWFAEEVES